MFTPAIALAYNPDLLDDEIYWIDKGTTVSYTSNSYFQGFTKYIANKDDKCFYLFSKFTDYRIDTSSNDNITFSFAIENEVHKYSIQIDKNGVLESSGQNVFNAFNVYYNFDNANCKKQPVGKKTVRQQSVRRFEDCNHILYRGFHIYFFSREHRTGRFLCRFAPV